MSNLLTAAAGNVARFKIRSAVVVLCLVAITAPYLTGIAISQGIRADALQSVEAGPDLYLTMDQFGRNGPVPMKYVAELRESLDILRVVPRITGRAVATLEIPDRQTAESKLVVLLGLEEKQMDEAPPPMEGTGPPGNHLGEALIGVALADYFSLHRGDSIRLRVGNVKMPFRISGIFRRDSSIWAARLICVRIEDAAKLFSMPGFASEVLIYCRPGPGNIQAVRQEVLDILGRQPYRLQTKEREVAAYVDKGFRHRQGIFTVLFLVAFAVGIPALLVASGLGLSERRREVGICKALGWQTADVITLVLFEQVVLSLISACLALLASFFWLRILNGFLVSQFFISEIENVAPFRVPAEFTPGPVAIAFLLCLTLTLSGGLFTAWRLASQPPAETIR